MNNGNQIRKHAIIALIENQPGVLARVVGLISGRGYNIESLNVGPTQDPGVSRMTMVVPGDDRVLEQVTKQLKKLVDVIKVTDLTREACINREYLMVKVAIKRENRSDVTNLANVCGGQIVSVHPRSLVVEMVGDQTSIAGFMELMKPFKIMDISRSGMIAMSKD
ncbi:MAG: acetolactate synthase small subunit [bacterium]